MAIIKKIKLSNNQTYDLRDGTAVRYTENQNLSIEQKARVVANIGAIPLPDTGSPGQVLKKTSTGVEWGDATSGGTSSGIEWEEF